MIKIKSDTKLFNEWVSMSSFVRVLNVIVQNDMEISEVDFNNWYQEATHVQDELRDLIMRTLNYVKSGQE